MIESYRIKIRETHENRGFQKQQDVCSENLGTALELLWSWIADGLFVGKMWMGINEVTKFA